VEIPELNFWSPTATFSWRQSTIYTYLWRSNSRLRKIMTVTASSAALDLVDLGF